MNEVMLKFKHYVKVQINQKWIYVLSNNLILDEKLEY